MTTILVVEDDAVNRELVTRFLRRDGHRVVHATDGLQAVDIAGKIVPALILMDLSLPNLDGWEATRQIKADARTAHIPIIALTVHAKAEDVKKARLAGCDGFETKPLIHKRLMAKIKALIESSSASAYARPAAR